MEEYKKVSYLIATFMKEIKEIMARSAGFEPATLCLEGRCSIQLS